MLTLFLVLACFWATVMLVVYLVIARLHGRWDAASHAYASRIADRCAEMLRPIDRAIARRCLLVTTVGVAALGWLIGDLPWQRTLLAIVGGCAGYQAPAFALRLYARRRLRLIDDQFGPALVLMASGLQAGLSLAQALELAVRESPSPLADELAVVVKEVHLGARIDDALRTLPRRLPVEDVQMAVEAILTLRQTGGDLIASFQVIAETMAERRKVEGRIRVITTEGMLQGVVMCLIPPAMLLLFLFTDPAAVRPILGHPVGWALLAVAFGLNSVGFVLMRKIMRVRV